MTLVADSGSTKTSWMSVQSDSKIVTHGLNPLFATDDDVREACQRVVAEWGAVDTLFFYGAGCGSEEARQRMYRLLCEGFRMEDVLIETDMMGACRAVCGHEPGLVGILGTGSNACYYDGQQIALQAPSTGYILGDHGSANHVGRRLLHDYLSNRMPTDVSRIFYDAYPYPRDGFLDAVYHRPNANRFLASLAPFAIRHSQDDYCRRVLLWSLDEWYLQQLESLIWHTDCRRLSVVGGFVAALGGILLDFAKEHGISIYSVVASPIELLCAYHGVHAR